MKKFASLLLSSALTVGLLAGCAGGFDSPSGGSASAVAALRGTAS